MGDIKAVLVDAEIPDRELHNSRMFIDICENIHIHYREFRQVFSLNEFFEYADILEKSTCDVRNFLAQNAAYREDTYPTTIMIAGGKARQRKFLENSPAPSRSVYFNNHFAIELQEESEVDEMHIHWRDYRMVLPRAHFRLIADLVATARRRLDELEAAQSYVRRPNLDRDVRRAKMAADAAQHDTQLKGVQRLPIDRIKSRFDDITKDFLADPTALRAIEQ